MTMNEAIENHFSIPPNIAMLVRQTVGCLYDGPTAYDGTWPSFVTACEIVSNWCDDNLSEVWYDTQSGEILTSAPEGHYEDELNGDILSVLNERVEQVWIEPYWEDYRHLEKQYVKNVLFDKELVSYI